MQICLQRDSTTLKNYIDFYFLMRWRICPASHIQFVPSACQGQFIILRFTYFTPESAVSQACFVLCSAASEVKLPLSKSGSTQTSWLGYRFESGLESDTAGAWSSTSEGSGLLRGERTDSDGGRMARGCEVAASLLLSVTLRFWSTATLLSPAEDPVRLFRGSGSAIMPTSRFKFLSKKCLATLGETEREIKLWQVIVELDIKSRDQNVKTDNRPCINWAEKELKLLKWKAQLCSPGKQQTRMGSCVGLHGDDELLHDSHFWPWNAPNNPELDYEERWNRKQEPSHCSFMLCIEHPP